MNDYGIKLLEFPIKNLEQTEILEYYDGPLLVESRCPNNIYLFSWTDCDKKFNRWIVWNILQENLYNYLQNKISLRDLILSCIDNKIYFIDINEKFEYENVFLLNKEEIPEEYLPSIESYYK